MPTKPDALRLDVAARWEALALMEDPGTDADWYPLWQRLPGQGAHSRWFFWCRMTEPQQERRWQLLRPGEWCAAIRTIRLGLSQAELFAQMRTHWGSRLTSRDASTISLYERGSRIPDDPTPWALALGLEPEELRAVLRGTATKALSRPLVSSELRRRGDEALKCARQKLRGHARQKLPEQDPPRLPSVPKIVSTGQEELVHQERAILLQQIAAQEQTIAAQEQMIAAQAQTIAVLRGLAVQQPPPGVGQPPPRRRGRAR